MEYVGVMLWYVFMLSACVVAIVIGFRRKASGILWASMTVFGALLVGSIFVWPGRGGDEGLKVLAVVCGLILCAAGCFGLLPRRTPRGRCAECDYPLQPIEHGGSYRCPECGTPHPDMKGHCLECGEDIRNAIAGGSLKCPYCQVLL